MREGDEAFEALRAAIDELAAREAEDLIAEARIEARAKVRSILAEAIAQALLDRSGEVLAGEGVDVGEVGGRASATRPAGAPATRPPEADAGAPASGPPVSAAETPGGARPAGARPADEPAAAPPAPPPAPAPSAPTDTAAPAAPREGNEALAEPATGLYVYCVISPGTFEPPPHLSGVGALGGSIGEVDRDGLAALASPVSLSEFGEERLRENLNDVGWLEETARRHEAVLEVALAATTVIPMRLCTVYASEESVREMLDRERRVFAEALARLEGRTEWGVKLFVDRDVLAAAAVSRSGELHALRAEVEALPEGEAYMKRRRLETLSAEEAEVIADGCVDDVHGRLAASASEALLNPLQRPEVTGHSGEMLLNGVYLVDDLVAESFHALVAQLREDYGELGFEVELTGPWPPYNFVGGSIEAAR